MSNPEKKIEQAAAKFQKEDLEEAKQSLEYKIQEEIGKLLESHSIDQAIVVFKVPDKNNPVLFYRGHFYDAAKLIAGAYHNCRDRIADDLTGGRF